MKISRTRVPKQCEFDAMVGANLQYMRKFRKLSMQKVAEQIPFTFQQLQKYEKGKNTISAYKLSMLCEIYGTAIEKIVRADFIHLHQNVLADDREIKWLNTEEPNLTPHQKDVKEELGRLHYMDRLKGRDYDYFKGDFSKYKKKEVTMPDGKTVFFPEGITAAALEKFKEKYMKKVHDH